MERSILGVKRIGHVRNTTLPSKSYHTEVGLDWTCLSHAPGKTKQMRPPGYVNLDEDGVDQHGDGRMIWTPFKKSNINQR